jgi:surface antigen
MTKIFSVLLMSSLLLFSSPSRAECSSQQIGGGEVAGTLLGAAVGGFIGSKIGKGTGNKVAIGAGVLAGGLLGNKLGSQLDCRDQEYHANTAQSSFETQKTGTTASWVNPDTGHAGSVTPTRTYQTEDGTPCREFTQTIEVNGQKQAGYGTACRQPDGSWRIVSSN